MLYAIIDIETTGGSPATDKITEIAIFVHDGHKVIDEFVSLINPEKYIPPYITDITGITNAMVASAPKFYEVARDIVLKTEGAVFVAHNVNFDYGFIKSEFKALGYDFERSKLDTVRLSRKLIPGHRSYSLGNICSELGIVIEGRHRAAGDALATVKLFELLMQLAGEKERPDSLLNLAGINSNPLTDKLPNKTGVYYFNDNGGKLLYIGKSINIKQRVIQHLANSAGKRAIEMRQKINDISYELTGSELVAMLLESDEIKKQNPLYNRKQRRALFNYGIYTAYDERGYIILKLERNNQKLGVPITTYTSFEEGRNHIFYLIEKYELCMKLCGQYDTEGACFHYGIKRCKGACCGAEPASEYNQRAKELINSFNFESASMFVVDHGRNEDEKSLVWINHGKYMGFGYLQNELIGDNEQMADCIKKYADNREVRQIINLYIRQKKYLRVIEV